MFYSAIITVIAINLLLLSSRINAHESCSEADRDSASITSCLLGQEKSRSPLHQYPNLDSTIAYNPISSNSSEIFRTDGTAPSEILRLKGISISAPLMLSSSMNRLLPYGNTAPLTSFSSGAGGFLLHPSRYEGTDYLFATQTSSLLLGPGPLLSLTTQPENLVVPETVIFWENGVFNQNTLNMRFSRPLSRKLMFNAFSNYRYFQGQRFNHERNDVLKFYSTFAPDTSVLMNRGYNPLVNEHITGITLSKQDDSASSWQTSFSYGDLSNEYALDRTHPTITIDRLQWAKLNRFVYRADAALLDKKIGPLGMDLNVRFSDETYRFFFPPLSSNLINDRKNAHKRDFDAKAEINLPISNESSIGLDHHATMSSYEFFDKSEKSYFENTPELFYNGNFKTGDIRGMLHGSAGASITYDGEAHVSPVAKASADFHIDKYRISLFARQGAIPIYPQFESDTFNLTVDGYTSAGGEIFINGGRAGLLLGYQYTGGIDTTTVTNAWLEGAAPYSQPTHTFVIAPGTSRWNGVALSAKALISDTRPFLKASGALSHVAHLTGSEFVETQLSFDYWSQRDPIEFAGLYAWSDPIYDLNLKVTAHIRSFRLFYKVDNLLNLRHSYVPGYFSPGVTFRWGINWYLQK